jgi:hypothetical protein
VNRNEPEPHEMWATDAETQTAKPCSFEGETNFPRSQCATVRLEGTVCSLSHVVQFLMVTRQGSEHPALRKIP